MPERRGKRGLGNEIQQASKAKQATSLTKQDSGTIKDVERINYYGIRTIKLNKK